MAIDGPSAAGKSTVARAVARRLGYRYLDTGAMYRSVALIALRRGIALTDAAALGRLADALAIEFAPVSSGEGVLADGEEVSEALRSPEVSAAASLVSAVEGVRSAMVARQRALAADGGVVVEGRDIGTVVFPDAEVKVFLDATLDARVRRRYEELRAREAPVTLEEVQRDEAERDRRDATRPLSPLRPAGDSVVIDTTTLSADQVADAVIRLVEERAGDVV